MIRQSACLALLLLTACSAQARPLVDMAVVDRDRGDWLSPVRYHGQDWIAGEPGHRYSVRLTNTTGERVLVVVSVDGVNAVTGQTASPGQAGYVLGPWQSTEISGWRKSLEDVAQFVFTDLPDSYAARTGRPDNVGVIGIAVFEEARPVYEDRAPVYERRELGAAGRADAAKAPAAAASEALARDQTRQSLGTGHGQREWSPAARTEFIRASRQPAQLTQFRYDGYRSLVARGVLPRHRDWPRRDDEPRAFPEGFVADP